MIDPEVKHDIQHLIETNELQEALKLLRGQIGNQRKAGKELNALSSRLNRIRERENLNVVAPEEADREINKIVFALLGILEREEAGAEPAKMSPWLKAGGALLLLLLVGGVYFSGFLTSGSQNDWQQRYEIIKDLSEGRAAVFDGRWGYVDENGALRIPSLYEEAGNFEDGMARVRLGGNYLYVDKDGNCVKDCETKEDTDEGMNVKFYGNDNKAIDARGGSVIINEGKKEEK